MRKVNYNKNTSSQTKKLLFIVSVAMVAIYVLTVGISNIFGQDDSPEIVTERPDDSVEQSYVRNENEVSRDDKFYEEKEVIKTYDGVRYGVSTSNPIASEIGMKVMEDGGNAVDAAVAISYALNITDPQNSGIGGGGGMLIYDTASGEKAFYDYYISSGDKEPIANIGIPGFVKGLETANRDFGKKTYGELIQYAIDLGEKGVEVTEGYEGILQRYNYIGQMHPSFTKDGELLKAGDILLQPDLVQTMKEIRDKGSDVFYGGEHEISKNFLNLTGISPEALKAYQVHRYEPLEGKYRGYDILSAPAPFSGSTVIQDLMLEEQLDIAEHDLTNPEYVQTMKNLLKFTASQGWRLNVDPSFTTINIQDGLDINKLLPKYQESIDEEVFIEEPETESTTAFSVIDKDGMVVSVTNTISNYWGSYSIFNGIIYNNAMKNFSNASENQFDFNKRPKTGISPVIITNSEGHLEALGANGGAKIPTYLFNYILNTKKYNMDPQQANDLERMFYTKGLMHFESGAPYEVSGENINFEGNYTTMVSSTRWGIMNGLEFRSNGEIRGHSDNRNYFGHGAIYSNGQETFTNE